MGNVTISTEFDAVYAVAVNEAPDDRAASFSDRNYMALDNKLYTLPAGVVSVWI